MMKPIVAVALTLAIAAVAPARAAAPVPYLPIPKDAAVILNTGSTNALGYRIVIAADGSAESVEGSARAKARVATALASKFFADLRAAMPLSKLRIEPCMKSTSFGSMTYLWWRGQRSLDVSCPGTARSSALNADADAIAQALHLDGSRPAQLPAGEPRRPVPSPTPTMSLLSVRVTARAW